jgi:hypothetical protein
MTRGQCGSLLLHCNGLSPSTSCRSSRRTAAQWLAYTLPYRRFANVLADACGRRGLLLLHRSGLSPHTPCQSPGALTRVAACTLALSPICDTLFEGFSHFVTSTTAPIASGWSVAGWGLHPLESAAFARRTPTADYRWQGARRLNRLTDASQARRRPRRARPVSFVVGDTPNGTLFPLGP